jgi:hypothetical protein
MAARSNALGLRRRAWVRDVASDVDAMMRRSGAHPKSQWRRTQEDVAPNKADVAPNVCGCGAKRIVTHCHFELFQWLSAPARGIRPLLGFFLLRASPCRQARASLFSDQSDHLELIPVLTRSPANKMWRLANPASHPCRRRGPFAPTRRRRLVWRRPAQIGFRQRAFAEPADDRVVRGASPFIPRESPTGLRPES